MVFVVIDKIFWIINHWPLLKGYSDSIPYNILSDCVYLDEIEHFAGLYSCIYLDYKKNANVVQIQ